MTAAGIALRCLTYDSQESCAHAARARACPILLSTLRKYADKPATARELLAALANCGSMKSVKEKHFVLGVWAGLAFEEKGVGME